MRELGIKIDLHVYTSTSLDRDTAGIDALTNAYRRQDFDLIKKIERVFKVKLSQKAVKDLYVKMEEGLCDAFLKRSVKRQEKLEREALQAKVRDSDIN